MGFVKLDGGFVHTIQHCVLFEVCRLRTTMMSTWRTGRAICMLGIILLLSLKPVHWYSRFICGWTICSTSCIAVDCPLYSTRYTIPRDLFGASKGTPVSTEEQIKMTITTSATPHESARAAGLFTGGHSKWDQILLVKIGQYIGFRVYLRSYLLWPPVINRRCHDIYLAI